MKRSPAVLTALFAFTTPAAAQNTAVEIHQFMSRMNGWCPACEIPTDLTLQPSDLTTNPEVSVAPGNAVLLAVWIRALPGDLGTTIVGSYNYEITAQGNIGSFAPTGRRVRDLPGYAPTVQSPNNPSIDYVDLPGADTQVFGVSGGVSGNLITSNAPGDSLGAFFIQMIQITAFPNAAVGDTLNLYLTTPHDPVASRYSTQGILASQNTVAFGATASGTLDKTRASDPTRDIIGTLSDRVSSTPDAVIHVIPEPSALIIFTLTILGLSTRRGPRGKGL